MPLLKKKVLEKKPLPELLRDEEEVFHCEMTNEIFRDYEEFAERTILCNSMVWTCCMTGKSNLTYSEAMQSEENARQSLRDFPLEMRIPVLFLANKTKRSSFGDMAEDVFCYIKERYFVGENVEASFSGVKWGEYHVLQVIMPNEAEYKSTPKNNGSSEDRLPYPASHMYKYDLEQLDADDDDVIEKMIVDFTQMRRKKGTFTREKSKLFLKQYVEQNSDGIWCVKESALENFGVNKTQFDQIFAGPLPDFENTKRLPKVVNGKKVRQETLARFLRDADGKELKINPFEDAKRKQEEKQKSKEEQKLKLAEERQKRKEENLKTAHLFKDWYRPKEDLELEDQRKFPTLSVVKTKVPNKYMGEVFMVVEFVKSFSKLLCTKDFFPGGFTVDIMERALMENEVAGPLIDLFQMLLSALFAQHEEEASQTRIIPEEYHELKILPDNPTLDECIRFATNATKFPEKHQGVSLGQLPMYSLTVTEILRLHLLSSGARINESGGRWRYQQRGGYTHEDDPGLYLRQHQPHLIKLLGVHNVVELKVGQKLELVSCLINQLLTFADVRDEIDERIESTKQKKQDMKTAQMMERKRCADVVTAKSRMRYNTELTKEQISAELGKIELSNQRHHAEYERKMKKLSKNSCDYQVNLGYDRAFRRYVKLDSVPGLFIDPCENHPGVCLKAPIHQIPELIDADRDILREHLRKTYEEMNTSDKENNPEKTPKTPKINGTNGTPDHEDDSKLLMCTADKSDCSVHSSDRCDSPWQFVSTVEELDELIHSLNKRGIRESELQQVLQSSYYKFEQCIADTPKHILNSDVDERTDKPVKKMKSRYEDCNFGFPSDADPVEVCRSTLVENVLEMEEKIFAGNLGSLKIKDRHRWRKCLAEGNFSDFDKTLIGKPVENGKVNSIKEEHESRSSRESTPDIKAFSFRDPGTTLGSTSTSMEVDGEEDEDDTEVNLSEEQKNAINCLSIALAQVARAVEPRYLKKPLGHADTKKGDTAPKDILANWEQSLLASTSYSQIFLHYGTLDGCIMWSRSALLARCRTCRRQTDSENMLLCDHCNFGYHLYCLKPKLSSIPQGEWFCPKCIQEKEKEQKLLNPEPEPAKRKRRIFRDEDIEEEEEEDGEGDTGDEGEKAADAENGQDKEQDSGDDENDAEGDKDELCVMCGSGGELLACEKCPNIYHIECIEPPLRRMPRGPWTCNCCKDKKKSEDRRSHREDDSDSSAEVSHATRRSIRREAEDLPLHNVALQDLLAEVMRHKDAWPFLRPVQKNEVPDYYDVISKPMDFGTIKYKLNMGKYMCDQELMSDAVLVFENCNTYNDTDADVYKCGVRLLKVFQKKAKELGLKVPEEMQDEEEEEVKPPKSKKRRTK